MGMSEDEIDSIEEIFAKEMAAKIAGIDHRRPARVVLKEPPGRIDNGEGIAGTARSRVASVMQPPRSLLPT